MSDSEFGPADGASVSLSSELSAKGSRDSSLSSMAVKPCSLGVEVAIEVIILNRSTGTRGKVRLASASSISLLRICNLAFFFWICVDPVQANIQIDNHNGNHNFGTMQRFFLR